MQSRSVDQIQQNFITPTNYKKIGAIFGGDFRIRTKNNKIKLENKGQGSKNMIDVAHDTKDDVG